MDMAKEYPTRFDLWVNRYGGLASVLSFVSIVITYLAGAIKTIKDFPLYIKIPFFVGLAALLIFVSLTLISYVRKRKYLPRAQSEPDAGIRQTFLEVVGGTISGLTATDNIMGIGRVAELPSRAPISLDAAGRERLRKEMTTISIEV